MAQLKVQQKKSSIGCKANQRETLRTLGLKRIGDVVVKEDRPEIRGMVHTVRHLVSVDVVDGVIGPETTTASGEGESK
jgi:large subunit ribosomal protein L30